uniref:Phosphoenolpyruvate carboxylase n=1 Tax=Rhizophora mucronata TaxID=61149 RepID=A0A2P2JT78_RHIMU
MTLFLLFLYLHFIFFIKATFFPPYMWPVSVKSSMLKA